MRLYRNDCAITTTGNHFPGFDPTYSWNAWRLNKAENKWVLVEVFTTRAAARRWLLAQNRKESTE